MDKLLVLKQFLQKNSQFSSINIHFVSIWPTKNKDKNTNPDILIAIGDPSLNNIKRQCNISNLYYEINSQPLETISIFDEQYFGK